MTVLQSFFLNILQPCFFSEHFQKSTCGLVFNLMVGFRMKSSNFSNFVTYIPANVSTSDQSCFNVVDQRWNDVDPTLKMKQNLTSDFQRWYNVSVRRCTTRINVAQLWYNIVSTLFQRRPNVSENWELYRTQSGYRWLWIYK